MKINLIPYLQLMQQRLLATLLLGLASAAYGADDGFVLAAAESADRTVTWQKQSIISGDFTCNGKREFAILGTKPKGIVIAVIRPPLRKPIDILRYSGEARDPSSAILTIESLDFDRKELEEQLGYWPDGLVPSKKCVGMNMTDQMIDSAHIYWHRKHRRFESWSL